jgi:hypothetical protein
LWQLDLDPLHVLQLHRVAATANLAGLPAPSPLALRAGNPVIDTAQGVVLIPGYTNNALIRCTDINQRLHP